jgi:TetR/AcrR family transcriptional regulator
MTPRSSLHKRIDPIGSDQAEDARTRILEAALREFSANGLAGARTERIAEGAGVNKALLYYYFRSKDALYAAALEVVSSRLVEIGMSVLSRECSAGERLLRSVLNHFDRIYSQPVFQNLMQQEMIRLREGKMNAENPLVEKLFKPMGEKMLAVVKEGIREGELIEAESTQVTYAALGANVFYFLSAPLMQLIGGADPLAANSLAFRRVAAIEFLGQAIFTDRKHGKRVAARVLAETPMPEAAAIGAYGGPEKAVAGSKATILKRRDRLNWE